MKILFVATVDSIHTARWLDQLRGQGWEIHLFPAQWPAKVHAALRDVTLHGVGLWRPEGLHASIRVAGVWPFAKGAFRVSQFIERRAPEFARRDCVLARSIRRLRPDIVHALEMQKSGYLTVDARRLAGTPFPPLIYSCWGNDLYYFGRQPEHAARIRRVLDVCDYFTADCERDLRLAGDYGFRGEVVGYFPGPGGFKIDELLKVREAAPVAARRTIVVKGYESWCGRALTALVAVQRCAELLRDYEIVVYSATPEVAAVVRHMALTTPLRIRVLPQSEQEDLIRIMGRSRIAIGNSVSDGTPNTMLEAMIMGAFPLQSDTVSTAEWIEHGRNGLLTNPEDPATIEDALRRAVADDRLVNEAAELNAGKTRARLDWGVVVPKVRAMYENVAKRMPVRQDAAKGRKAGSC